MYAWLVDKVGKLAALAIVVALLLVVIGGGYLAVRHFFTSGLKTEVKLSRNQTGAAIDSGSDAVETVGNRQAADEAGRKTVEETKNDVNKQTDAGGVTDAGRRGLCGLAGYRSKPECLRTAPPR